MEQNKTKETEKKGLSEGNKKRLLLFGGGAVVLFFLLPLVLQQLSEENQMMGEFVRLFILNQIFMAVVGWHANYFPKYGIYIPAVFILIYLASELVFFGTITWSMEFDYLQAGYILFFLKKFITRKQILDEKKKNKPFPKGVGRK
ncbi:MAG: hypothetical protein Q4C58_09175 [Eubacteriales bacterium]|nr:hypothetical protein [Eubacteriales bacterium]